MTTEVSGRIAGRSVFEPFSAHRASTRLKVGGNQLPTTSKEGRKAPRGANTQKTGPGHGVDVPAGRDTWEKARARRRPRVTITTKGKGAGAIARAPRP